VIDARTNTIVGSIAVDGVAARIVDPSLTTMYVAVGDGVAVVDLRTKTVTTTIRGGGFFIPAIDVNVATGNVDAANYFESTLTAIDHPKGAKATP
jgi:DNA-binding beta-propeller fold protein YncE